MFFNLTPPPSKTLSSKKFETPKILFKISKPKDFVQKNDFTKISQHFTRFQKHYFFCLTSTPPPPRKKDPNVFLGKFTQTFCLHSFPCSQHQKLMRLSVYLNTLHVFLCRVSVEKNINNQ